MWGSDSFMFASLAEELGTGFGFQAAAASLTPFRVKTSKSELARQIFLSSRHGTVMETLANSSSAAGS
jgi:hypothetical protein